MSARALVLLLTAALLSPGCGHVAQRKVLRAVGELPNAATGEEGSGLLASVDALERQLADLETSIAQAGLAQEYLTLQNHQIHSRYEQRLRLLALEAPAAISPAAAQQIRAIQAQQILEAWAQELADARAQARAIEEQAASLHAAASALKQALVSFKEGGRDPASLETFNQHLATAAELLVQAQALGLALGSFQQTAGTVRLSMPGGE